MVGTRASPAWPEWRNEADYADLLDTGPTALAWEWLRRDPAYRRAAHGRWPKLRDGLAVAPSAAAAARWGLHVFEDPQLPARAARPVWRRELLERVLVATASAGGSSADRLDLERFAALATVVRGADGREHILLSDGSSSLRLDIVEGSLLAAPACLDYQLAGLTGVRHPLETLQNLLRLCESGRLPRLSGTRRTARLVVILRAWDALATGTSQREIAATLLSADALRGRWRSTAPSLRLQAQRLVRSARHFAAGGYRDLVV